MMRKILLSAVALLLGASLLDAADYTIRNNLVPGATGTYDLGTATLRWRNGYINVLYVSGAIHGRIDTANYAWHSLVADTSNYAFMSDTAFYLYNHGVPIPGDDFLKAYTDTATNLSVLDRFYFGKYGIPNVGYVYIDDGTISDAEWHSNIPLRIRASSGSGFKDRYHGLIIRNNADTRTVLRIDTMSYNPLHVYDYEGRESHFGYESKTYRILVTDSLGADSSWWFDDGDTTKFGSDNPIKIWNALFKQDTISTPNLKVTSLYDLITGKMFIIDTSKVSYSTQALQSYPVATNAPSSGQVLTWDGSRWAPAAGGGGVSNPLWLKNGSDSVGLMVGADSALLLTNVENKLILQNVFLISDPKLVQWNDAYIENGVSNATAWNGGEIYVGGDFSTAWNDGSCFDVNSTAWNAGTAFGDFATAWNNGGASAELATGWNSGSAMAYLSTSFNFGMSYGDTSVSWNRGKTEGPSATAFNGGLASGYNSVAWGFAPAEIETRSQAIGDNSTAFNLGQAGGYNSVVIGRGGLGYDAANSIMLSANIDFPYADSAEQIIMSAYNGIRYVETNNQVMSWYDNVTGRTDTVMWYFGPGLDTFFVKANIPIKIGDSSLVIDTAGYIIIGRNSIVVPPTGPINIWAGIVFGKSTVTDSTSSIVAGDNDHVDAPYSLIAGGSSDTIIGSEFNVIAGGTKNLLWGTASSAIVGGRNNRIKDAEGLASSSFIGGGEYNVIDGLTSCNAIVGGYGNYIGHNSFESVILGGKDNRIDSAGTLRSTISGGEMHWIKPFASHGFIGGGRANSIAAGEYSGVGWGRNNADSGEYSGIVCGRGNINRSNYSIIGGGRHNSIGTTVGSHYAVIGGGDSNIVGSSYSTIPGGKNAQTWQEGQFSIANGSNRSNGDAQTSVYNYKSVWRGGTDTITVGKYYVPSYCDTMAITFTVHITAVSDSGSKSGNSAHCIYHGSFCYINGTSLLDTVRAYSYDKYDSFWIGIKSSGDTIKIRGYGPQSSRSKWTATIYANENLAY